MSLSSAVSLSLFCLASELNTESKLSIRMPNMMSRVVMSCDILAVVATSATGVYGAPNRAKRTIHVLTLLTSVSVPDFIVSTSCFWKFPSLPFSISIHAHRLVHANYLNDSHMKFPFVLLLFFTEITKHATTLFPCKMSTLVLANVL